MYSERGGLGNRYRIDDVVVCKSSGQGGELSNKESILETS